MLLHENEVINDVLSIEGLKIIQRTDFFNFSLDSILLAGFLTINRTSKKILDLGTGNGVIPLLLARRSKAKIYGIELQEVSADLAKRNVSLNLLDERIEIINDDMLNHKHHFEDEFFDSIVCNPPFFKFSGNEEQLNDLDQLTLARHEISIDLDGIVSVASKLLKQRGYFAMVHRADRIDEILASFHKYNIAPKRIQFCHSNPVKNAKILLIEGMKSSESSLTVLPPLFTHKGREYSDEVKKLFRGEF